MKRLLVAVMIAALTLCIAGCSPSVAVDRTVVVQDMIVTVPSTWIEDETVYDNSYSKTVLGNNSYHNEEGDAGVTISFSNADLNESMSDVMEDTKSVYTGESIGAERYECVELDSCVVDGAPCVIYKITYVSHNIDRTLWTALIHSSTMHYEISGYGDEDVFYEVLDSVSLT